MTEQEAIDELMAMTPAQLDVTTYDKVKWVCSAKKCGNGTHVRDYGLAPTYYHHRWKPNWFNVGERFCLCGKHWKLYKRLLKNYDEQHVYEKLIDPDKPKIQKAK